MSAHCNQACMVMIRKERGRQVDARSGVDCEGCNRFICERGDE